MVCVFFGHKKTPSGIVPILHRTLVALIEQRRVDTFFVGNQGEFDQMVRKELKELSRKYPWIRYSVVLAYMPGERTAADTYDYSDTVYPEGLEDTAPKFAIEKRNRMLVELADLVVVYVVRSFGGAAKFKALAERKGKEVINIGAEE